MPLPIQPILGALLVLAGVALLTVAVLGSRSRLIRNRWAGVRTATTLSSDAAFTVANGVAAAPTGAAGTVATAGGAVLLAGADGPLGWVVFAISVVGMLVLAGLGGMVGDRAAAGLLPPSPTPPACAGACASCELRCADGTLDP